MTRRFIAFTKSPLSILLAYGISITAFGFAYNSNTNQLEESEKRASQVEAQNRAIEAQNERLRIAFCGIVEPYAASPQPPSTPAGATLKESFKRAASNEGLGCTPDPSDGR